MLKRKKWCFKCKAEYPATRKYWYKDKGYLSSPCKGEFTFYKRGTSYGIGPVYE